MIAIYARENGQGMAFPQVRAASTKGSDAPAARAGGASADADSRGNGDADVRLVPPTAGSGEGPDGPPTGNRPKPTLTRVK